MATKRAKAIKKPKPRNDKYEEKLKINGAFEDLLKELATPVLPVKKVS